MNPVRPSSENPAEDLPGSARRGPKGFKAALQDWLADDLAERLGDLDLETLAIFATSPVWTYSATAGWWRRPAGNQAAFLDRAVQRGWIETAADTARLGLEFSLSPASQEGWRRRNQSPPRGLAEEIGLVPTLRSDSPAGETNPDALFVTSAPPPPPTPLLRALGIRCAHSEMIEMGLLVNLEVRLRLGDRPEVLVLKGVVVGNAPALEGGCMVSVWLGAPDHPAHDVWCGRLYGEFAMPRDRRTELLQYLERNQRVNLRGLCAKAARGVLSSGSAGSEIPPALADWALVAGELEAGEEAAAAQLRAECEARLREGRTGEALQLLQVGQFLAEALGGSVLMGNRLMLRQLEQAYRRSMDERHLSGFLERRSQRAACEDLLASGQTSWALHLLGVGGMGKTMLIRYLAARLAPERGLLVSRVDFDYLTPDYPVRRPGQLLLALADGLLAYGTGSRFEDVLKEFQIRTARLHGELDVHPSPADPLENLHRPAFAELLSAFCDLIRVLPVKPVLFILDTCEELAKLQPDGAFLPGVEATFEILERIQQNLARDSQDPALRVVFAGRRLLCPAGDGWEAGAPMAGTLRPYLRLHEIRGFDEAEAQQFLKVCKRPDPKTGRGPMSDSLAQAIMERSREMPLPPGQRERVVRKIERQAPEEVGYNPFKLNLYADWWLEKPDLDESKIRDDPDDPYVEHRIVRRLQPGLRETLPYLVLVRRWDEALLERLFRRGPEATADLYRELGQLEWTDYQPYLGSCLGINENQLPGLEQFIWSREWNQRTRVVGDQLSRALAELIRDTPLREIVPEYFEAALALLPPDQAALLWEEMEERLPREADAKWTQDITALILGERGRLRGPLRASVSATQILALQRTQPEFDAFERWREIEEWVEPPASPDESKLASPTAVPLPSGLGPIAPQTAYPYNAPMANPPLANAPVTTAGPGFAPPSATGSPQPRFVGPGRPATPRSAQPSTTLKRLALAFQVHARAKTGALPPSDPLGSRFWNWVAHWEPEDTRQASLEDGAIASALESLVELAESRADQGLLNAQALARWASHERPPAQAIFAALLIGRTTLLSLEELEPQDPHAERKRSWGEKILRDAALQAAALPPEATATTPTAWPDLTHLRTRARLDWLLSIRREAGPFEKPPEEASQWVADALGELPSSEADRLLSLLWGQRLHHELIPRAELDRMIKAGAAALPAPPDRLAHRKVPPLCLTLAEAYSAAGFPGLGLAAIARAPWLAGSEMARRTAGNVIRRYRLTVSHSEAPGDMAAAYAETALCGDPSQRPLPDVVQVPVESLPNWWRAYAPAVPGKLDDALRTAAARLPLPENTANGDDDDDSGSADPILAMLAELRRLDLAEAERLGYKVLPESLPLLRVKSADAGARLRLNALRPGENDVLQIPNRAVAELALEEGSLLALRLPELAVTRLLKPAADRFRLSEDPIGVFQASVAGLLAWIRAGKLDAARQWAETRVRRAYLDLRPSFSSWPPWPPDDPSSSLWDTPPMHSALLDSPTSPRWLRDPDWAEWLKRLFAAMTFLADPSLQKTEAWDAWSVRHLGSAIPVELRLLRRDLAGRSGWAATKRLLPLGAGLLIFFAVGYTLFRVFDRGWERWIAVDTSLWIRLPAFLGLILLVSALFTWLGPRLRKLPALSAIGSAVFGTIALRLTLRPASSAPGVIARLQARYSFVSGIFEDLFRPFLQRNLGSYPVEMLGEGAVWTPDHLNLDLRPQTSPGPVAEALLKSNQTMQALLRWLAPKNWPIELELDPTLAASSWETALFAELNPDPVQGSVNFYCLYRLVAGRPPERWRFAYFTRKWNVQTAEPSVWRRQTRRAWETFKFGRIRWVKLVPAVEALEAGATKSSSPAPKELPLAERTPIVHLIGRAEASPRGSLLVIEDRLPAHDPGLVQPARFQLSAQSVGQLAGTPLVIIQGEPVVVSGTAFPDPTQTERDSIQRLRRFAQETASAGAWAVLLLPPLPADLAFEVVSIIQRHLGLLAYPSTRRLRHVLAAVQQHIDSWARPAGTPPPLAQREAALAVTLFARTH